MVPEKSLRINRTIHLFINFIVKSIKMQKKFSRILFKNIVTFSGLAIFFALTSCEEDLAKVNDKKSTNFASRIIYNADIVKKDSGMVKVRFKAPLLEEYEFVDTPYVVVRKGLYLEFYDSKKPKTPGKLWAKYAKMIDKKQFYEARGNVKVINNEGQTFARDFYSCFEKVYFSYEIGIRKPDENAFRYIINNHNLNPKKTLFIDDKKENTDVAEKLGFKIWNIQPGVEDVTQLFDKKII